MGEGFDLREFLEQQRREGVEQGEGAFTIASDKLLTKVAKFSLPRDEDWVLKIVQAVNAWCAQRLVIRQTRLATSFFFCPPDKTSFPTEGRLIQSLSAGVLEADQPIAMLSMALRSLVDQVGLSFVLALRQDDATGKPIFAGDDTSALSPEVREQWSSLNRNGVRLTVSHFRGSESSKGRYVPTFAGIPRRDLAITGVLESLAYTSGVPIHLDGRLLTNRIWRGCPRVISFATTEFERSTGTRAFVGRHRVLTIPEKVSAECRGLPSPGDTLVFTKDIGLAGRGISGLGARQARAHSDLGQVWSGGETTEAQEQLTRIVALTVPSRRPVAQRPDRPFCAD